MTLIKSISGIRGIVNNGLDYSIIEKFAFAFLKLQKPGGILIARDGRSHGLEFSQKLCESLKAANQIVIDCGIVPTPTAQFIVENNNYAGGIIITASHNPTEWNGLKFIDSDGCFIKSEKYKKLISLVSNETHIQLSPNPNSQLIDYNNEAINKHLNNITNLSLIDIERIKNKEYKVVVDAVNSSTSKILPQLLKQFSCDITELNCNADGHFNRGAEPLPHNLSEISKKVIETKSDFGIATDPDGDRLAIIDEKGNPIGEESTLVICCESLLMNKKINSPLVTNLSTSMAIDKLAEKYNVNVVRCNVGEINVVTKMKEVGCLIGGEGNGGVILSESHYGRDSLVATALLLNRLSMNDITMSELHSSIPHYEIVKDFIKTDKTIDSKFINTIEKQFNPDEMNQMDGIKLIWGNKWIHIRKSNTEPIVRFYAEAETTQESLDLINKSKEIFSK
ncbi:MAG: phosphoglucosamine mutase [Candidatus Marinimicrobia bacterium]|nr:phosphoglucosamine mutase [Candidatus Neomarinimicrobiota bacterium]